MIHRLAFALLFAATALFSALAQDETSEVRVSVVLNADGSRTTYETNAATHKTVATTTSKDGKLREKISYDLDENGRFARAEISGPKEQFRLGAEYRPDHVGGLRRGGQRPPGDAPARTTTRFE